MRKSAKLYTIYVVTNGYSIEQKDVRRKERRRGIKSKCAERTRERML